MKMQRAKNNQDNPKEQVGHYHISRLSLELQKLISYSTGVMINRTELDGARHIWFLGF